MWASLALLLKRPIGGLVIRRAYIDSGFRPGKPINLPVNRIYEFARQFRGLVFATKGRSTQEKPIVQSRIEVTAHGTARPFGLELIWLDTDWCKSWVHERVRWTPEKPGSWYLPEDVSDGYCKAIVSEVRVRKPSGAPHWVRRSRENHYLDCEALQAALQHSLNLHLIRDDGGDLPAATRALQTAAAAVPTPPAAGASTVAVRSTADQRRTAIQARFAALGRRMRG